MTHIYQQLLESDLALSDLYRITNLNLSKSLHGWVWRKVDKNDMKRWPWTHRKEWPQKNTTHFHAKHLHLPSDQPCTRNGIFYLMEELVNQSPPLQTKWVVLWVQKLKSFLSPAGYYLTDLLTFSKIRCSLVTVSRTYSEISRLWLVVIGHTDSQQSNADWRYLLQLTKRRLFRVVGEISKNTTRHVLVIPKEYIKGSFQKSKMMEDKVDSWRYSFH